MSSAVITQAEDVVALATTPNPNPNPNQAEDVVTLAYHQHLLVLSDTISGFLQFGYALYLSSEAEAIWLPMPTLVLIPVAVLTILWRDEALLELLDQRAAAEEEWMQVTLTTQPSP
tara:strand:+ start:153 stop:500 length:348 start_codon:yes stop_codon:yes gene_type:complete